MYKATFDPFISCAPTVALVASGRSAKVTSRTPSEASKSQSAGQVAHVRVATDNGHLAALWQRYANVRQLVRNRSVQR